MNQTKLNKKVNSNLAAIPGFVKLYAHGKLGLMFSGDKRFIKVAEQCFAKSIRVTLKWDREKFEDEMGKHGIPTDVINKFAEDYSLDDDIWLSKDSNWPT
jgi:hypothetical protein